MLHIVAENAILTYVKNVSENLELEHIQLS